jgi:hypothetical protein
MYQASWGCDRAHEGKVSMVYRAYTSRFYQFLYAVNWKGKVWVSTYPRVIKGFASVGVDKGCNINIAGDFTKARISSTDRIVEGRLCLEHEARTGDQG